MLQPFPGKRDYHRMLKIKFILLSLSLACGTFAHASSTVSEDLAKEALMQQLDEERLAYQLYTALGEVHPELRQFQNIPRAEARHFLALKNFFVQNYPEIEQLELKGDFIHPATQALYDRLYAEGKTSPEAALNAGVQVEELDIKDLDAALATTESPALKTIYKRLRAGSERHLAAFSGQKGGQGKGKKNKQGAKAGKYGKACDPANCSSKSNCANPENCAKADKAKGKGQGGQGVKRGNCCAR